jgi:hypothetical protein
MRTSDKNKSSLLLVLLSTTVVFAFGLICIIGSGGGGGGGGNVGDVGDESDGGAETIGDGSEIIEIKAVMGPIVGATVWVAPINDMNNFLASGITEDSGDINEAGHVTLEIPPEYAEIPLYVQVNGGVDIDADDNGVRDNVPTDNDITLEFAVPTPEDLEGMAIVANPLLLYASYHVIENVWGEAVTTVDDFSDPETIMTLMRNVARALIKEDVDGDGSIDWQDIISFHPLIDQEKSRIPWEYVIDDIERLRQEYAAQLGVIYSEPFFIDPLDQEPIDVGGDKDFSDFIITDFPEYYSYVIGFNTNKNNYTIQNLVDGQGVRGGKVTLPDNQKITYMWCEEAEEGELEECPIEEDDTEPPLWAPHVIDFPDNDIAAYCGGHIFYPTEAPVGEYTIEYSTGDGQQHQEAIYLHENRAETYFNIIPSIEVDEEGFIDRIDLRFEDENGIELQEPSILGGSIIIWTWGDSIEEVNSMVRGEGYYERIEGEGSLALYSQGISLLTPSASHYPTNNGHKIYYEDAHHISVSFEAGDGVDRSVDIWPTHYKLYPQVDGRSVDNGQITVGFLNAEATDREAVSMMYKFDDGAWTEVDTLTVDVPEGARIMYVSLADISGFYWYPPPEIDLTE